MKYKLMAIDIDGTLLDSRGKIPGENLRAIARAREAGVAVVISSGRSALAMRGIRRELGLLGAGGFASALNGAVIMNGETLLRETRMSAGEALPVLSRLKTFDGAAVIAYTEYDNFAVESMSEAAGLYALHTGTRALLVASLEKAAAAPPGMLNILALGGEELVREISRVMAPCLPENVNIFRSSARLVEFTSGSATKGRSLEYIAGLLGIGRGEIIAMGDNENDVSMAETAGLFIAPANAAEVALRAAGHVTRAANGGGAVAEVIEEFVLG